MLYEVFRGKFKRLGLARADKNFLAIYENSSSSYTHMQSRK
jgi:hypothetical protein